MKQRNNIGQLKTILVNNVFYVLMITAFIAIQLCFSSLYRGISRDADKINQEYALISLKTQTLDAKIADLSSLSGIEKRAKKLGFVPVTDIIYLTSDNVLAKNQ